MNLVIGCDSLLIEQSHAIRQEVFVIEQDIPLELDRDGKDSVSQHAILYLNCQPVGCARLTISHRWAVLSRVAVLDAYRGAKLADVLVNALLRYARRQHVYYVSVLVHQYLADYYKELGFTFAKGGEMVGKHQLIELAISLETPANVVTA
ncbi:GNAT family N-acetyltransferase [Vibrio fluminensis]|uniref:GNAT family N-acetyltransferase n=1 Tax=Vibrio fluminensis TaxID=2783614 RepID=UPI0018892D4A|nr:GNAT family N-acetyltransferase [Vibrio fluminensis]